MLSPVTPAVAVVPTFLWARPATNRFEGGHLGGSWARSVASDCASNIIVAGAFNSTVVDFGGVRLTNSAFGQGNFLCKYDSFGNLLWGRLAGTTPDSRPLMVATDASANVWVAGYFSGTFLFGTNSLSSSTAVTLFVAKYNPAGEVLWARVISGYDPNSFNPLGFTVTPDGSAYLASRCNNRVDFGTIILTNATAFLCKYSNGGNLVYAQSALAGDAIASTSDGGVCLTGPGLLAKYDSHGFLGWSRPFLNGTAIALDAQDNIYTTGYGSGTYDGLVLTNSGGVGEFFVGKSSPSGTLQWARQVGGIQQERGTSVALDRYGNVFVTGLSATANAEPVLVFGETTLTNVLWFVAKYSASGKPQWALSSSPSVRASAVGLAVTSPDAVHVAGYFYTNTKFGNLALSESETWFSGAAYVAKIETGESPLIPVLNPIAPSLARQIMVTGSPGLSYILEASTNLTQWYPVCTNSSPFQFTDSQSINFPIRFYRALLSQ